MLADKAAGEYATERVYDDAKVEDIESLDPKTQIHREVDITVTQADLDGKGILPFRSWIRVLWNWYQ